MDKRALRAEARRVRAAVGDRARRSAQICAQVQALPEFARAHCVFAYAATGSEVDLFPAIEAALRAGKAVCLPVCREKGQMDAVRLRAREDLAPGAFGILEPRGEVVPPEEIDLVLCPGLAFDRRGGRLGYGGGYYDRYLGKVHAFLLGICYTDCIVGAVPMGAHDVFMDALACETGILRIGG